MKINSIVTNSRSVKILLAAWHLIISTFSQSRVIRALGGLIKKLLAIARYDYAGGSVCIAYLNRLHRDSTTQPVQFLGGIIIFLIAAAVIIWFKGLAAGV